MKRKLSQVLPLLVGVSCLMAGPATAVSGSPELLDLSIEQLLDMEVTSASRRKQSLSDVAAAMFVITHDDIRRSGVRNIPEALRMAPGLSVAQIDASRWAISARGFSGKFANKLLVLMDGRALYTPSYAGVYWDSQDVLMDNIERIEVIRGPGASLWGSNAVNGVINIITRDAREMHGGLASTSYDDRGSVSGALRAGGGGEAFAYQGFVKYTDMDGNRDVDGNATADGWHQARAGGRVDWRRDAGDTLTLTAEAYTGHSGGVWNVGSLTPPYQLRVNQADRLHGAFALGRWARSWDENQESSVQVTVDLARRESLLLNEDRDSVGLEGQHHFRLGRVNDFVVGAGFHHNSFRFDRTTYTAIDPDSPSDTRVQAFIQDEISLAGGRVLLTAGAKFEHNDLSDKDLDILPSVRASWKVADGHSLWGAVTRAVRTPSWGDIGASATRIGYLPVLPAMTPANPLPLAVQVQVAGNRDFVSEKLDAFEAGYRGQISSNLSVDASFFFNRYDRLRSIVPTGLYCDSTGEFVNPAAPPACLFTATSLLARLTIGNESELDTYGAETSLDWRVTDRARVTAAYSYLHIERQSGLDSLDQDIAGYDPKHRLSLRGEFQMGSDVDLGVWLRYTGRLNETAVSAHWNADVSLTWRAAGGLELALTGRNLLHVSHLEFITEVRDIAPIEIERSVAGTIRWRY